MAEFIPSFPGGVVNPVSGGGGENVPGLQEVAAFAAPETSHIWGWKYADRRLYPNLTVGVLGPVSLLFVRFRDPKTGGPIKAEYVYGFDDPDEGQRISDMMASSPHPYSEVLHPKVMKTGVSYTRV